MSIIYCDEAGNTGANLLDPEQPVFVLASNDFSAEEAGNLLLHVLVEQRGGVPAAFELLTSDEHQVMGS